VGDIELLIVFVIGNLTKLLKMNLDGKISWVTISLLSQ
jgi:hypothetical protein